MKPLTFVLLALTFVLSACGASAEEPFNDDAPLSSDGPPEPQTGDFDPKPGDASLRREGAYVGTADLLTLESFPLQFVLALSGELSTPCNKLRVEVSPPDANNRINVEVYSVIDTETLCAEVIQPFEVNVPLGSFPEGAYTLWVNGEMVAEFQS